MSNSSDDLIFPLKKEIFYRKPLTVDLSEILYHFLKETDQIPLPYKQQWCRSYNKVGYKLQENNNLLHYSPTSLYSRLSYSWKFPKLQLDLEFLVCWSWPNHGW